MKFFSIILIFLSINFTSFAFAPAESKSTFLVSENTSKTEAKKSELGNNKAYLKKINSKELIEKLEANKSKMNFKERLATKLIIKKLKKQSKEVNSSKIVKDKNDGLANVFKIAGVTLVLAGVLFLVVGIASTGAGIGLIVAGLLFFILPFLI